MASAIHTRVFSVGSYRATEASAVYFAWYTNSVVQEGGIPFGKNQVSLKNISA